MAVFRSRAPRTRDGDHRAAASITARWSAPRNTTQAKRVTLLPGELSGTVRAAMVQDSTRLLIVDDDRRFAQELCVDAERLGLAVEMVHEPIAFGPVLSSWRPDIIAMDLVMPDTDGLELLHADRKSVV